MDTFPERPNIEQPNKVDGEIPSSDYGIFESPGDGKAIFRFQVEGWSITPPH